MHIGKEVEGRFRNIKTLFMNAQELMDNFQDLISFLEKNRNVSQVYVSDHQNTLDLNNCWELAELSKGVTVTVEVTALINDVPEYVNVILFIDRPDFIYLNNTDQVKFEPVEKHVLTVTVENMTCTLPNEFKGDQPLNFKYSSQDYSDCYSKEEQLHA